MKFAFSSNAFTNHSLTDSIGEIAKIGYDGIEIMCDVPHAFPPNLDKEQIIKINKSLQKNKLQISNLNAFTLFGVGDTYHPSWIENDESQRQRRINHTVDCINLAKALGSKNISIEPGGPIDNPLQRNKYLKLFAEGINKILPIAEKEQVKILIEPEPKLLLETSKEFLSFIRDFDSNYLRLNFDIGHFYCVNEDPSSLIILLEEYIEHFHMADIENRVHYHLIPGLGSIDFKKVFLSMKEIGYEGFVTVELYPYKENPSEAAKKSLEFLKLITDHLN